MHPTPLPLRFLIPTLRMKWSPGWRLFREALNQTGRFAEYGSGASTLFVDRLGTHESLSVETDPFWVQKIKSHLSARTTIVGVDVGPVGAWGRPLSYDKADNFYEYFQAVFSKGFKPELILIDGRFRVACFLTCLLHAQPGTRIIWDDYAHRRNYHVVEQILEPFSVNERQALFIVPKKKDVPAINRLLKQFRLVMD